MKVIPAQIVGDHVMLTGPVRGTVELADGTTVDVTDPVIDVSAKSQEEVEEISFLIGQHYVENGHPDDRELDDNPDSETYGQIVQRPFVADVPEQFQDHPGLYAGEPAGVPAAPLSESASTTTSQE